MKILGEPLFAKDAEGKLKARLGTVFLSSPRGIVVGNDAHVKQRKAWIDHLNHIRQESGEPPLSDIEISDVMAESVNLLFEGDDVLILPDPQRVELALRADEALQELVSKRRIRFVNTHTKRIRDALRARGENWRMSNETRTREEVDRRIAESRVAVGCEPLYYYNCKTGTRYVTVGSYSVLRELGDEAFRAQISEVAAGLNSRNRFGLPDVALFPDALDPKVRGMFASLKIDSLSDSQLREAVAKIELEWRMALPSDLRDENPTTNLVWRAEMDAALSRSQNETNVSDNELVQGISPEFYRQIEWLPGARVDKGQLLFDPLFDEFRRTSDPELARICDSRVRSIIFNLLRLFGTIEYVNVGRIANSLARTPVGGARRGNVYIVQYKEACQPVSRVFVIRFQKWGIAEHLDEGKDMLSAILEANSYADYILDRRLACRQLGMRLPSHVGFGQFTEKYTGANEYSGTTIRAYYYVRQYVPGIASDKIPPEKFRNPAFAVKFAELMGEAAAIDLVVGRRATETNEPIFDRIHEVLQIAPSGLPARLVVTDHAGSFVDYKTPLAEGVKPYADVVTRREKFVADYAEFAKAYVAAFERKLVEVQSFYRDRPKAFDDLFSGRPYDQAGSGAYRWACVLKRLAECDPKAVATELKKAIQSA